ncbi:MAG: ABC transporter substrate-binding protein, partial [Alphaproteobacteria bacterium]|nr:ABC transporter substrate-binding protein [Alphaproteobacteria bacterium]
GAAAAEISDGAVKIGLILDLSGPYSENTGQGSVAAAKMAVADFGGKVLGAPIEVLVEDHHNSADQAAAIARDWFDHKGVDAILDVTGSSEALIVQRIGDVRHKIVSLSGPGADRLTNEACTATSIHYVFDTYSIAHTVGSALVDRGEKTWFFITVDYSFGYDLERDTVEVVTAKGGEVVGRARHPLDTADFSSYLARAQQSKAQVIGLANAGGDMTNTIKQAKKLGMIPGPQTFAAMSLRITGVHALGLDTTQGLTLGESFYWDLDDATRAWSKRFFDIVGKMPNSLQAGLYSSVTHYLQAVKTAGTDATDPVMAAMKATPIDDFFARGGHIRADGLMVHDTRLFQVKAPSESKYPWDYLKLVATIPADQAFPPLSQSKCPLVKQ